MFRSWVHVLIEQDGSIIQTRRFSKRGSAIRRHPILNPTGNDGLIHIELVGLEGCNKNIEQSQPPTAQQIATAMKLSKLIFEKYNIKQIVGHYDIPGNVYTDPRQLFPMKAIRDYVFHQKN